MAPEPSGVTRDELHFRRIDMRGYRRSDGLYEVEGRVTDTKPRDFAPGAGAGEVVPAFAPIHDMGVRLVFDHDMVIHEVASFMDATPFPVCRGGGQALQNLKGVRIGNGWSREVRSRLGGAASCTHLMEILIPLATTAFQTMSTERRDRPEPLDARGRPKKIDSCYAYAAHTDVVRRRWPQFHRPPPSGDRTQDEKVMIADSVPGE
jgi:hypothetical protein